MASVLSVFLFFVPQASALDNHQMLALDNLVRERKASAEALAQPVLVATVRVDALEKRMLPVVFTFNRLGPVVLQRNQELDSLKIYLDDRTNEVNPYDDSNWIATTRKETAHVCCDVRRNPRLAHEIQENLAKGLPALSTATSATVADRARAAVGGKGADSVDEESLSQEPGGSVAPVPSNRKGMISGLPDLNAPPPPPPRSRFSLPTPTAGVPPAPSDGTQSVSPPEPSGVRPSAAPSVVPPAQGASPPSDVNPSGVPPSAPPAEP